MCIIIIIACRGRDREQGPRRQEEDGGADQALPGRPPAVSLLTKITSHILQLSKSWRAARRPGRAWSAPPSSSCLLGPCSRSLPRQAMERRRPLLHVSLRITLRQTVSTRSSSVIRCLPKHVAHVPKCTRLPLRFSLSGQRSYAYAGAWERG